MGSGADRMIILPASRVLNRDIHTRGYKAALTALSNGFIGFIHIFSNLSMRQSYNLYKKAQSFGFELIPHP